MNWGKGIVVAFVFFALFIAALVTICLRQQIGLVSSDYYSQELRYQEQIDQAANTARLGVKPTVVARAGMIELNYPDLATVEDGKLFLIRPSDAARDRTFEVLATPDSIARFDATALPAGKYNLRFTWRMNNQSFLMEHTIIL